MTPRDGNPRLSPDQEKIIAWLIRNGHEYHGEGYYGPEWSFGDEGRAVGSSSDRLALQALMWCVSDWPEADSDYESERDRYASCEASLPAEEQARILALVPDVPVTHLELADPSGEAVVTEPGEVELSVSTRPAVRSALTWNQSVTDGDPCQVYATFSDFSVPAVGDATALRVAEAEDPTEEPTDEPTEEPTDDPSDEVVDDGAEDEELALTGFDPRLLLVVAASLVLGTLLLALGRRTGTGR